MITKETIDEIMQTARIEEVIGDFVNLKKSGSSLKGLSPFVDEKTPSFMVSPGKQIFKDFSSGKGGNVVTFLMEVEHFSYPEALRWLADRYNITIQEDREQTPEDKERYNERESLGIVNGFARDHFVQNIFETNDGKAIGLSYFKERGFTNEIIEKFQLGYCSEKSDGLTKAAIEAGHNVDYLLKLGLTKEKDGRQFDFFRGRVMFPIHSISGKVLGFGGRTLRTDKKIAKYFNSPESSIYNKSKILYGLYFSKNEIIKRDNCFLVEGYTDVISMHQSGVENVVASSGTALTSDQIKLIKRYTNNITILYDGDPAGIKASFRGIDLILEEGLNVKVVLFPDGDDPDSYAKKVSKEELLNYINHNAQDFIAFKSGVLLDESKGDPIVKAKLIRDIVQSIALIPDQIIRSVYIKECSVQFDMPEQTLINELNKLRKTKIAKEFKAPEMEEIPIEAMIPQEYLDEQGKVPGKPEKDSKRDEAFYQEFDLIRILVKYGCYAIKINHINEQNEQEEVETSVSELIIHELDKDELYPRNVLFKKLFDIVKDGLSNQTLYEHTYFLQNSDAEIVNLAVEIFSSQHSLSTQWFERHRIDTNLESDKLNQAVIGCIYSFKAQKVEEEINAIRNKLKNFNQESDDLNDLLKRQIELEVVKKKLSDKTGRIILR